MGSGSDGIGRRALLTVGAALGAGASPAVAAPRELGPALPLGLFTALPSTAVPDAVSVIETLGHTVPGVGGARYVAAKAQGPGADRVRTANGRWFALAEPLVFVEMFGALGGDPWRDDGPAIQAAIDAVAARGGGVVWCTPGRDYYIGRTLVIDPTRISIEGGSAVWDFRLKPFAGRGEHEGENDASADNACILVRVPPESTQYGHDSHFCRALKIKGPASNPHVADGLYFDTPTPAYSSRWTLYNVEASENLGRGLVLRDRAYLTKAYGCSFGGFHAGVEFIGREDAGENFSFFGGNLGSGGGPGLKNHGGEFYLFGVSIDFPKSFIRQTGGTTHCFGCHFETGGRANFVGRPFDIVGDLYIDGGQIMGGAALDGSPIPYDAFFYARDNHSRIVLSNVWGYNWQGADHVMCGGPGRFVIERLLGGTNWNIPGIVKRDASHSLVGEAGLFEREDSRLDLWVAGQGAGQRLSRSHVAWSNGGQDYGALTAQRSTAQARTGVASLAVTKAGVGPGTGADLNILIPFPPGGHRMRSCEFWVKAVAHEAHGAPAPLFTQLFWANLIGRDGFGAQDIGQSQYTGEAKLEVRPEGGDSPWTRLAYGDPIYADPADPSAGYAPAWATHLWLKISLVSLPAATVYIDDLYAFAI